MKQLTGFPYLYDLTFTSLGPKMLVVFDSDHEGASSGFMAIFNFEEANPNASYPCSVDDPCNVDDGHCYYDGQCAGTLKCGQNNCPQDSSINCCYDYCGQFLDMENGIFNYFEKNDMEECSWAIQVPANQIITIEFDVDYDLWVSLSNPIYKTTKVCPL